MVVMAVGLGTLVLVGFIALILGGMRDGRESYQEREARRQRKYNW